MTSFSYQSPDKLKCCFAFDQTKGAEKILLFDALFLLSPLRMVFAWWTITNRSKIHICCKFRLMTFWFYALILLLLAVGHTVTNILYGLQEELLIVFATTDIVLYMVILATDYHFCMVLKQYA